LINAISGRKRKSPSIKELLINDTIVSDDKVIAESFNDFFTNVGINLAAESDQLYNNLGDDPNFHQHCPGTRFYFSDISVSNFALRLQNLKASKAILKLLKIEKSVKITVQFRFYPL
jgi:hypothetical protein